MFKNMTLQTRLISSFLFMGLIVLIVALLGWFITNELNSYIDILINNHIPSISGIWKINEGQTQIQSAERLLFDPEMTDVERQNTLAQMKSGWEQVDEGLKQYEATPLTEQEKKEYETFKRSLESWKQAHERFLQIEQDYTQLGIRNPWKKQGELISQQKETSSELATLQAALTLRQRMDSDGATKEEPLFKTTDEQALKLLQLNESYIVDTQKEVQQNIARSIFWICLGIIIGPVTAIIFGVLIARQIAEQVSSLLIQVSSSSSQIATSGKQLEVTVTEQVASTNEVAAAAREISATSKELVKTMEEVAVMSQATTTAATESQKDLLRMETTMRQLAEATNSIASRLGVMSEKANN
ncbi:MCP four helix bundle domain-containing protein, partial [Pelatocladus sp. BLCC-F211]|uniref:MCP four helix bundle domain-containing protein n=1 Tax=Pelatocladus sp. BLCC-F211 TaxID=3342752 RepID=UPI0035B7B5DD